jgi:hypothetical protein
MTRIGAWAGLVAVLAGDDVVLTAPLYSNPGLLQVGTGEIAPDADRPQDEPIQPIPLMSPPTVFDERALAALPEPADAEARVDGAAQAGRYWRPTPGTKFSFPAP